MGCDGMMDDGWALDVRGEKTTTKFSVKINNKKHFDQYAFSRQFMNYNHYNHLYIYPNSHDIFLIFLKKSLKS